MFCLPSPQEDVAFKQKQKDDKKKMEEAKQAAAKKGPMGVFVSAIRMRLCHYSTCFKHTRTHAHTRTHTHTHTHTHTRTHANTYTYTYTNSTQVQACTHDMHAHTTYMHTLPHLISCIDVCV